HRHRPAPPPAAGTAGLDVHDRLAGEPEAGQHLVPGGDAAVDRPAIRRLKTAALAARFLQSHAYGGDTKIDHALVVETTERMDADAGDVDGAHGRYRSG